MTYFQQTLKSDRLQTKRELEDALIQLITPIFSQMKNQKSKGRVHIGDTGAVYPKDKQEIEGFLRTLWGLGPLFAQEKPRNQYADLFAQAGQGILAGVDPDNEAYWGELADYDQLFVEMGALTSYLLYTKEAFWSTLSPDHKQMICSWLDQINHHTIPKTNWLFFRILVNTFFDQVDFNFSEQQLFIDLQEIDRYYLDDGWYFDGYKDQIDYYIPFGMQYYGLLYSYFTAR